MADNTIKIGGELESMATGKIVAAASAIKDKSRNKTQEVINGDVEAAIAEQSAQFEALSEETSAAVASASESASDAAEFYSSILDAMDNLGSGEAVAAQVAINTASLNSTPNLANKNNTDLDIADENHNVLARFSEGHFQTKQFDSRKTPKLESSESSDLDIADENGCVIARFQSGEIKTKNFDSANVSGQMPTSADFDIADENGCVILRIQGGHIKTKNFDSSTSGGGGGFSHELNGLKVLIVGDSITVGQGLTDPTTQRWGNQLAAKYNWNLTLDAQGGIPLASNASNRNCIVKKLESNLNSMQSAPPDLVIIWGGHNDRSYQATPFGDFTESDKTNWCGCLRYCAEKCHQYAPNAKIFILTMLHGGTYNPTATMSLTPEKTVFDMGNAIFDAGRMFGMEVVDMSLCGINEVSGDSGNLTSDNTHPNLLGTKQIVDFLSRQLELRYVKYKNL